MNVGLQNKWVLKSKNKRFLINLFDKKVELWSQPSPVSWE